MGGRSSVGVSYSRRRAFSHINSLMRHYEGLAQGFMELCAGYRGLKKSYLSAIEGMSKLVSGLKEDVRELKDEVKETESITNDLLTESSESSRELMSKNRKLLDRVSFLEAENQRLKNEILRNKTYDKVESFSEGLNKLPRDIDEVVGWAKATLSDYLVFSDYPFDSLKSHSRDQVDEAWKLLKSLPYLWYLLYGPEKRSGDFIKDFRDRTGLRFSQGETNHFKNSSDNLKRRTFKFGKRSVVCLWHVGRIPSEYNTAIRCYFYPDAATEKLMVGYIGIHL